MEYFIILAWICRSVLRPVNRASFEEMSQRWRVVGNTVSDLTGPRFESQTSRSRDERVTAWPTDNSKIKTLIFFENILYLKSIPFCPVRFIAQKVLDDLAKRLFGIP